MGKKLKTIISIAMGVPAVMIFAGEGGIEYFGVQILAGAVLIGILAWNGVFCREELA
jgi:hypothetical protein